MVKKFESSGHGENSLTMVYDILECIEERLKKVVKPESLAPIAFMYAYNQGNTETAKYCKIAVSTISEQKAIVRGIVSEILPKKRKQVTYYEEP